MPIKILKTKKEYQQSLERFEDIFQAKDGTAESDDADVLALLIKD
jgi:HTH-type transcriptional regulator/antitoxin HigA